MNSVFIYITIGIILTSFFYFGDIIDIFKKNKEESLFIVVMIFIMIIATIIMNKVNSDFILPTIVIVGALGQISKQKIIQTIFKEK